MYEITQNDVEQIFLVAAQRVAKCLEIDITNKPFYRLFSEISNTDSQLYDLLDDFYGKYRQYQNWHIHLSKQEFKGILPSESDKETLVKHMNKRDQSRQALLSACKQIDGI